MNEPVNSWKIEDEYLYIHFAGAFDDGWSLERVRYIADKSRELKQCRVLVDTTDLKGQPNDYCHAYASLEIARLMPGCPRIAILMRAEHVSELIQNLAATGGADVLATHDFAEARKFLRLGAGRYRELKGNTRFAAW